MNEGLPQELLEALRAMGVDYGVPGDPRPVAALPPRLDSWLERMDATQIGYVHKRYAPKDKGTSKAARMAAIRATLGSRAQLEALVGGLTSLEHALLWQVKQAGGMVSGWQLVAVALMLDLAPPLLGQSGLQLYGRAIAENPPGRGYLLPMLRDGLLLPASTSSTWTGRNWYYDSDPTPLVWADPRLLEALPPPPPREWTRLNLARVEAPPAERTPLHVLLEWAESFKLILEEGQLAFNKDGSLSKAYLKRLIKKRPALEAVLPLHLGLIPWMGLITDTDPARPALEVWTALRDTPLEQRYGLLLEAFSGHYQEGGDAYSQRDARYPFALIQGLRLLPGAVPLEPALDLLNRRMLRYFYTEVFYRPGAKNEALPPVDVYRELLKGEFSRLALADTVQLEGKAVLRLGKGLEWMERAASAARGSTPPAPVGRPPLVVQPNFEVLAYLELLTPQALSALEAMDLLRLDAQTATYTLSRSSVYRALESGLSLETLLELLGSQSALPLSPAMVSTLRDWALRRERITVTAGVTLLEFPTREARDARVGLQKHLLPLGDTYALASSKTPHKDLLTYRYDTAPERSLRFAGDDLLLEGVGDWLVQDLLSSFARKTGPGRYTLELDALRAGKLTSERKTALEARLRGPFPRALNTLLELWNGKQKPPALVPTTLFQHPQAIFLAEHPRLKPFLNQPLNPTTYTVAHDQLGAFQKALLELHIAPGTALEAGPAQTPQTALLENLPTRKLRGLIEDAIAAGRSLELKYHEEKYAGGWGPKTQGKLRRETITPSSVVYEGSTPYFVGKTGDGEARRVRIGYIVGIAVV